MASALAFSGWSAVPQYSVREFNPDDRPRECVFPARVEQGPKLVDGPLRPLTALTALTVLNVLTRTAAGALGGRCNLFPNIGLCIAIPDNSAARKAWNSYRWEHSMVSPR